MKRLMTKHFHKWANKQKISDQDLSNALEEVENGQYEATLSAYLIKKRVRFEGMGKSGSGRTIICYKHNDKAIYLHGFAKNEKSNLTDKELKAFKALSKVLINLSEEDIILAIAQGDFIEVTP